MRRFIVLFSVLFVSACYTVTDTSRGSVHTLIYKPSIPDSMTGNALPTAPMETILAVKAQEACPSGYEKVREYHVSAPPDGSHQVWEIRCFK